VIGETDGNLRRTNRREKVDFISAKVRTRQKKEYARRLIDRILEMSKESHLYPREPAKGEATQPSGLCAKPGVTCPEIPRRPRRSMIFDGMQNAGACFQNNHSTDRYYQETRTRRFCSPCSRITETWECGGLIVESKRSVLDDPVAARRKLSLQIGRTVKLRYGSGKDDRRSSTGACRSSVFGSPWTLLTYMVEAKGSKNFDVDEASTTNREAARTSCLPGTDTVVEYLVPMRGLRRRTGAPTRGRASSSRLRFSLRLCATFARTSKRAARP